MSAEPISAAAPIAALSPQLRQRERRTRLTGLALMAPAVLLVALFLFLPLVFILQMSFTEGNSFLSPAGATYTLQNYVAMAGRYLPNLFITIELAFLAMIVDLIFGVPFAYILGEPARFPSGAEYLPPQPVTVFRRITHSLRRAFPEVIGPATSLDTVVPHVPLPEEYDVPTPLEVHAREALLLGDGGDTIATFRFGTSAA
jgi:ABC-type phosphate/phosphonate transport system permease subunit